MSGSQSTSRDPAPEPSEELAPDASNGPAERTGKPSIPGWDEDVALVDAIRWTKNLSRLKAEITKILESDCIVPELERPLTFSQVKHLTLIDEGCRGDGCWSLQRLADELTISLPALSKNVSKLAAMGLVEVRQDPFDGRKRRVSLTDLGTAAVERFTAWRNDRLRNMVHDITPDEVAVWNASMEGMLVRLENFNAELEERGASRR